MGGITSGVAKRVPWRVAPDSGFEVDDPTGKGNVGIVQINARQFSVLNAFQFSNQAIEAYLVDKLVRSGKGKSEARRAVDNARTFTPRQDNPTDLASIPRFLRWFEDPYGKHSLAALIHDELITGTTNSGALGSDTLSDRFFREMMRTSGVPFLKRWIMWSAVALRTRFVAGGPRRLSVVAWLLLSVVGISIAVGASGSLLRLWSWPVSRLWTFVAALVLLVIAAPLWGKQWAASLVAAVAALWLVPAAAVAYFAYGIYLVLERIARLVGLR